MSKELLLRNHFRVYQHFGRLNDGYMTKLLCLGKRNKFPKKLYLKCRINHKENTQHLSANIRDIHLSVQILVKLYKNDHTPMTTIIKSYSHGMVDSFFAKNKNKE